MIYEHVDERAKVWEEVEKLKDLKDPSHQTIYLMLKWWLPTVEHEKFWWRDVTLHGVRLHLGFFCYHFVLQVRPVLDKFFGTGVLCDQLSIFLKMAEPLDFHQYWALWFIQAVTAQGEKFRNKEAVEEEFVKLMKAVDAFGRPTVPRKRK